MSARFGPAGSADSFHAMGYRKTSQMPEYLEKMGLNALSTNVDAVYALAGKQHGNWEIYRERKGLSFLCMHLTLFPFPARKKRSGTKALIISCKARLRRMRWVPTVLWFTPGLVPR